MLLFTLADDDIFMPGEEFRITLLIMWNAYQANTIKFLHITAFGNLITFCVKYIIGCYITNFGHRYAFLATYYFMQLSESLEQFKVPTANVPKRYCDSNEMQKAFTNNLWRAYSLCMQNIIL